MTKLLTQGVREEVEYLRCFAYKNEACSMVNLTQTYVDTAQEKDNIRHVTANKILRSLECFPNVVLINHEATRVACRKHLFLRNFNYFLCYSVIIIENNWNNCYCRLSNNFWLTIQLKWSLYLRNNTLHIFTFLCSGTIHQESSVSRNR